MDIIGWGGSTLLAFCGLPQVIETIRRGNTEGISTVFLWVWGIGEVLTFIYVFPRLDVPLLFNYSANILFITIILKYRYFPRR